MRAKHRRRFHFAVFLLVLGPGGVISILYPRSLVWIIIMSWGALVYAPLSAWSAETPVESEEGSTDSLSLKQEDGQFGFSCAGGACGCRVE